MLTALVLFIIVMWLFAGIGIAISRKRSCPTPCVAIYGILMFFLVMLPLFIEGTAFSKLGSLDEEELDAFCSMTDWGFRRSGNRLLGSFFRFSRNFDHLSSELPDKYMCSSTCPCLNYGKNPSTEEYYRALDPEVLAKHNRTFDANDKTKKYMNFTDDENVGFKNFDECYVNWMDITL